MNNSEIFEASMLAPTTGMLEIYNNETYLDNSRQWFKAFLKHTNEKEVLGRTIRDFVTEAHKNGYFTGFNKILDIGCGAGDLVRKIANAFAPPVGTGLAYHCIEYNPESSKKTDAMFIDEGNPGIVYNGNAFTFDFSSFTYQFDFIIVSHAAYYALDIGQFIASLMKVVSKEGAIMMIHETKESPLNWLRENFAGPFNWQTAEKISSFLRDSSSEYTRNFIISNIVMDDNLFNQLKNWNMTNSLASNVVELKHLLEFIIHKPLERLDAKMAEDFIEAVTEVAEKNDGTIPIISEVDLIAPRGLIVSYINSEAARNFVDEYS